MGDTICLYTWWRWSTAGVVPRLLSAKGVTNPSIKSSSHASATRSRLWLLDSLKIPTIWGATLAVGSAGRKRKVYPWMILDIGRRAALQSLFLREQRVWIVRWRILVADGPYGFEFGLRFSAFLFVFQSFGFLSSALVLWFEWIGNFDTHFQFFWFGWSPSSLRLIPIRWRFLLDKQRLLDWTWSHMISTCLRAPLVVLTQFS